MGLVYFVIKNIKMKNVSKKLAIGLLSMGGLSLVSCDKSKKELEKFKENHKGESCGTGHTQDQEKNKS